jgi:hypothetical protein
VRRLIRTLATTELVASATRLIVGGVDKLVAESVRRTEAPHGAESFGQDLDELVRLWRRRGELDRNIKVELFRKADSL